MGSSVTTNAVQALLFKESNAIAMTCDVEDYFQVSAFEGLVPRDQWRDVECRIPQNIDRTLLCLDKYGAKATFFTLGWVAEHYPEVVRRIAGEGHEIASHGMAHFRVWSQQPQEFLEDASRSRKLLEDLTGNEVSGYRAASWSVDHRTPWAHDVLAEAGYRYSSSIYPIPHDHFGVPDAPTFPHIAGKSGLVEIPASTTPIFGRNVPIAGGGYFRLYPLLLSHWLLRRARRASRAPCNFYFHPWELDPDQPRMSGASRRSHIKHYLNLKKFEKRWCSLLATYRWDRMDRIFLEGSIK